MPDPEPFDQFLARTASAQLEPYLKAFLASPAGRPWTYRPWRPNSRK